MKYGKLTFVLGFAVLSAVVIGVVRLARDPAPQTLTPTTQELPTLAAPCSCVLLYDSWSDGKNRTFALDFDTQTTSVLEALGDGPVVPSPNHKTVAAVSVDGHSVVLWQLSVQTAQTVFTSGETEYVSDIQWTVDGETLLIVVRPESTADVATPPPSAVYAIDTTSGARRTILTSTDVAVVAPNQSWSVLWGGSTAETLLLNTGTRDTQILTWKWTGAGKKLQPVMSEVDWSIYLNADNGSLVWSRFQGLHVLSIEKLEEKVIPLASPWSDQPFSVIRPQGGALAFLSSTPNPEAGQLGLLDLSTGQTRVWPAASVQSPSGVSGTVWTPDGTGLLGIDQQTGDLLLWSETQTGRLAVLPTDAVLRGILQK